MFAIKKGSLRLRCLVLQRTNVWSGEKEKPGSILKHVQEEKKTDSETSKIKKSNEREIFGVEEDNSNSQQVSQVGKCCVEID
jgi:hypothetical protein